MQQKNEDEAKELTPEEFQDFMNTYDAALKTNEDGSFLPLDQALEQAFNINEGKLID